MTQPQTTPEPPLAGVRQVLTMSFPIILGSLSFVIMEFGDKWMVAKVSTEAFAAIGSASIWSFTVATLFVGIIGCVSTFVAQCYGKEDFRGCAVYTWQAIYLALPLGLVALLMLPLSEPLFRSMQHSESLTALEVSYFRIRLLSYIAIGWTTALSGFFQAVNRAWIPMLTTFFGIGLNIFLNWLWIYGNWGFPRLELAGAAWATVTSMYTVLIVMQAIYLLPWFDQRYHTRRAWRFSLPRTRELVRIGLPGGLTHFLDIAVWGIFTSYVIGWFGEVPLAANTAAMVFLHLCFMPAVGLNQGIAAIVGQWIGAGDIARAKARTWTAIKLAMAYMVPTGITLAIFGSQLVSLFSDQPEVIRLGHKLLILAAIFQAFDAVNITCMGALRGAGDTRFMMWVMFFGSYVAFLPMALVLAFVVSMGAFGAWLGATIYISGLSFVLFRRFNSERWRHINIFSEADTPAAT